MSQFTDSELLLDIARGAEAKNIAFTEIYNRYSTRVYLYCRKIMGDSRLAEDIFQETFLKFLAAAEKGANIKNVLGYLLKISKNLMLNYRQANPQNFVDVDDLHIPYNDTTYESIEFSRMVDEALKLLPPEHKEAFILQTYQGLTFNEIGELTGVPLTTVRNRVVRAKRKLREILKPYLDYSRGKEHE